MKKYIGLPYGIDATIIGDELSLELLAYEKIEVVSENYIYDKKTYTIFHSKVTGRLHAVETA